MYSKVESEPKDEVTTSEREFKFAKRMALHSASMVNNLGLKFLL